MIEPPLMILAGTQLAAFIEPTMPKGEPGGRFVSAVALFLLGGGTVWVAGVLLGRAAGLLL